jgi:1-acyl-sn-glycerol-3-phosphate acyltransferase
MDALAIIYSTKKQPVFMARADIFKKDTAKKVLTFLKIIPVYRIRDGIESLSNNDDSFELAFQVLKHKGAVGIMPEGNHGEQRRLRPLKKGIARLAIQAQELLGNEASIKIVPVGLDFSTYQDFRGKMLVQYGKPIDVKQYLDEYNANAAKGLQSLKKRLADDMKAIMLNIDTNEYYDTIYDAKELYSYSRHDEITSYDEKFKLDKQLSDKLVDLAGTSPDQAAMLKLRMDELNEACSRLKISPWVFSWKSPDKFSRWLSDVTQYIFFLPIFCFSALFHAIPYFASEFYSNKVEDKQFVSSMRFVVSFLMYLVWYLIVLVIPFSLLFKLALLLTMPVLGLMSYDYWDSLKRMKIKLRYLLLKKQNSKALNDAKALHERIIHWLSAKLA